MGKCVTPCLDSCLDSVKCNVSPASSYAQHFRDTVVFIVDEVSMSRYALDAIDLMLRDFCGNQIAFGGNIMVFGGDFRQTLPIVRHACEDEIIQGSVVSSPLWKLCRRFALTTNMRAKEGEVSFAQFLLDLENNNLPLRSSLPFTGCMEIPQPCIASEQLSETIFPSGISSDDMHDRVILAPTNQSILIKKNDTILK